MRFREILHEMSHAEAVALWRRVGGTDPTSLEPKQLRASYRKLITANHPDVGGDTATAALINSAYDVLSQRSGASDAKTRPAARSESDFEPWAQAGHSGGMPNSSRIYRHDYRDVNFIKKRMWELSGKSREEWTIWGFDGSYLRGVVTVYGSAQIFAEMAHAMVTWQTKGGNPYACRAVLVNRRRDPNYLLIWADGRLYDKDPIPLESESPNANPSNDRRFESNLRRLIDAVSRDH